MVNDKQQSELTLLRSQQRKTLQDEVFGGLSNAERSEYDRRAQRIHALELEIRAAALSEVELRRQWDKDSETDTPRRDARQPYRSRENDSTTAFTTPLQAKRDDSKKKDEE